MIMRSSTDSTQLPHDNRGHVLIGVVVTVLSIATLAVALRFYTRGHVLKNQLGADDFLSLFALLFAIATGVAQCVNTDHGLGAHVWDLNGPETVAYLKNFYVSIAFYNTGLFFVKLTFLAQYYRVIVLRKFRIICIVAMVLIGTWSASQVLVGIFICIPIAGFWNPSIPSRCVAQLTQWYLNAAVNILTDIVIFILPLPVLAHLSLPRAQKLPLLAIFSLGFFTCAISVIRIKFLKEGEDFSYQNVEGSSWSITELCSGVICSCLPTLRPLVARYVPALANKVHHSSRGHHRKASSGVTDVEEAREIARRQKALEMVPNRARKISQDDLYRCDTDYDVPGSIASGESSDGILGLRDTKESLYGSKPASPVSMTSPAVPARAQSPRQYSGSVRPDRVWLQPSVTTTISTGGIVDDREQQYHHHPGATRSHSDMIQVTHDIEQSSRRGSSPGILK